MTAKRQFAERPHRQKYNQYQGVLGVVVGIDGRDSAGHIWYKLKCSDCGEIHLRDSRQLQRSMKSQDCKFFKPYNWSGFEREDAIMRRQYGISMEEFDGLLAFQGGGCAICSKPIEEIRRRMNIDHDHKNGKVRGILCSGCNTGLGHLGDNIEGLKKALYYLENTPFNEYANAR
jgi:hypothetical protein